MKWNIYFLFAQISFIHHISRSFILFPCDSVPKEPQELQLLYCLTFIYEINEWGLIFSSPLLLYLFPVLETLEWSSGQRMTELLDSWTDPCHCSWGQFYCSHFILFDSYYERVDMPYRNFHLLRRVVFHQKTSKV